MATESSSLLTPPLADMIKTHRNRRFVTMTVSQSVFDGWSTGYYNKNTDRVSEITKPLYAQFKDDFDFIIFILDNAAVPKGQPTGMNVTVSNTIEGIGRPINSEAAKYGSAGRLKSHLTIWSRNIIENGPYLHELCHNWANYAIPAEAVTGKLETVPEGKSNGGHWGFSGCGGALGGFDQSTLRTNVDDKPNKYHANMPDKQAFGFNANGSRSYSNFELYLMGLIPESELTPFDVFTGTSVAPADVTATGWNGNFSATTRTTYDREKIVALLGKRVPSSEVSQKQFNVLVVVLTTVATLGEDAESIVDAQLDRMTRPRSDDIWWLQNFWEATGGRATLTCDLSSSAK